MPSAPERRTTSPWSRVAPLPEALRYRVFLSYSHRDAAWARWLVRRLETFRVPRRFHGQAAPIGPVGARIAPVFRDRDELPTTSDLGEAVRAALRESATLVVICSPAAAKSRWVAEEIMAFKRLHGGERVYALIIGGEPNAPGGPDDCFPPALRHALDPGGQLSDAPAELVAADARPAADGREDAFVRLVAGLLGVGFDDLRQRERHRRQRRFTAIAIGVVAALALAAVAWIARGDARRRQEQGELLLGFMLGDQRAQLKRLGRLDVLEQYDTKALAFFRSLDERDLTETALLRQAQALRQIGEDRVEQMRYAEAQAAFHTALSRATALVARAPRNGDLLYERGQSEYWIGLVHRKRGELAEMARWWTRYRDTSLALVELDPKRVEWRGELAWGHHNLAAYDADRGRPDDARRGFLAELEILAPLIAGAPADLDLRYREVDANSWLGSVEEQSGNFAAAGRHFSLQVAELEAIIERQPGNLKWRMNLADALGLRAMIHTVTGERAAALAGRQRATEIMQALVASDPTNRNWKRMFLNTRVKEARLRFSQGEPADAGAILAPVLPPLEDLLAAEPTDASVTGTLAAASRLQAELLEAAGQPGARAQLTRAIELGERIATRNSGRPEIVADLVRALVMSARLAARERDPERAAREAARAKSLIEPAAKSSTHWQLHDARARVLAFLQESAAAEVIERLRHLGYVPLEPWPELPPATSLVR